MGQRCRLPAPVRRQGSQKAAENGANAKKADENANKGTDGNVETTAEEEDKK